MSKPVSDEILMHDGGNWWLFTVQAFVKAAFYRHVWYRNQFKLAVFVFLVKVFRHPLALLHIAHGSSDVISQFQQLVSNMTPDKTIHAGDEDSSSGLDDGSWHGDRRGVWRGRRAFVSKKGVNTQVSQKPPKTWQSKGKNQGKLGSDGGEKVSSRR